MQLETADRMNEVHFCLHAATVETADRMNEVHDCLHADKMSAGALR